MEHLSVSDCQLDKLNIKAANGVYDLMPHLLELNIYENIFSYNLTGNVSLTDSFNLPYKLPICGEEIIDCKFSLPAMADFMPVECPPLHVTNISDRFTKQANSNQQYTLKFVSEQAISNAHATVSKAYTDLPISDIVLDIWETYLDDDRKGLVLEKTYGNMNCIIPNWTPYHAINWLLARARPQEEGNAVNYVYYETIDNIVCKSLQTLSQNKPTVTMGMEQRVSDAHSVEALSSGHVKVDKLYFMDNFKKMRNISDGNYTSKLLTHDITTKKIMQYDYSSLDDWQDYNHVSKNPPIANSEIEAKSANEIRTSFAPRAWEWSIEEGKRLSQQTDSKIHLYPTHTNLYQNSAASPDQVLYENDVEYWRCQRYAHLSYFTTNAIRMQVECGGLNFLRTGLIVYLVVPSAEGCIRPEEAFDKFLTGNYMVTAIRHVVTTAMANTDYKMIVDLVKDGHAEMSPERMIMTT